MSKNKKLVRFFLILLASVGLIDAIYLTINHFKGQTPVCAVEGCEIVLTSSFATIGIIPISLFGVIFYAAIIFLSFFIDKRWSLFSIMTLASLGLGISLVLVYIQLYVIKSVCIYCMISAGLTSLIFLTALYLFSKRKEFFV